VVNEAGHRIRERMRRTETQPSLYGLWRDRFPPDFDIDAALEDIRHDWDWDSESFLP
jgi:hypothetical protein